MKKALLSIALFAAVSAFAQQTATTGEGGTVAQQLIGDVDNTKASSNASQINPSANANGATITVPTDVRVQNNPTFTPTTTSSALGANLALGNNSEATAKTEQVVNGNSKATTGASTSSTGAIDNASSATAKGGAGGAGGQGGKAAQGQQQGIKDSGNSAATATAGKQSTAVRNSAGNGAGAGAGSGNPVTMQGDTDQSRTQVWANPVLHGGAAAAVPAANLIQQRGVCGPRIRVVTTQVIGIRFGFFGGQSEVPLGYTDKVGPYLNEDGTPGDLFVVDPVTGWLIGGQFDTYGATLTVSSANSISLGAFSGGDAAQGGVASSGGMQTIGLKIVVSPCVMSVARAPAERQTRADDGLARRLAPRPDRN